jgi:Bifunctional DNA primase/polymerase, N-terminal
LVRPSLWNDFMSEYSETPPKEAAWQVLDRVTAVRKNLLARGYNLTPTNGKRPFLDGWQNIETTEAEIERWAREYPAALNTGLQTRDTPGVDIDVLDEAVAEELQNLLWLMIGDNGQALVRYGRRPKRAVLFQTSEPFDKLSTPFFISPNGDAHRVEVLCDGQQFIVHGTHPDTGAAYVWEGGEPTSVPRDDLPHLSASVAADFVAKAAELMRARGWIIQGKQKNGDARKSNGSATGGGAADFDSIYGGREQKWASAALTDLAAELAAMAPETGRNERLYRAAFRMGTMVARGWIERATVEDRLLAACRANALERDTGGDAVRASLRSGSTVARLCRMPILMTDQPGATKQGRQPRVR